MSNKGAEITGFSEYQEKKAAAEEAAKELEGMSNCNFDSNGQYVKPKPGKSLEEYYDDDKPRKAEVVPPPQGEQEIKEEKEPLLKEDNPLDGATIEQLNAMMKNLTNMTTMMEETWVSTKNEFKLTDDHMKNLYQYNEQHRIKAPNNLSPEEMEKWDYFNGLNEIPEDEIIKIFGEEHPIIGVDVSQTRDRIKTVMGDYFNWISASKELNETNVAYMQYIEQNEIAQMEELRVVMENESDPEKKAKMQAALDKYWSNKYLDFLRDPLEEREIKMLIEAYGNTDKASYWVQRCREKLKQLNINQKIILELSQFEIRYLPEKYHRISNMLLLKFIQVTRYANMSDEKDEDRTRSIAMAIALDFVIRNIFDQEKRQKVLDNVMAYLDQMIEPTIKAYPELVNGNIKDKDVDDKPKE